MFCDQDDIWEKDKVEKTLAKMEKIERIYYNQPILIHTNLKVVDENLQLINKSFWDHEHIDPQFNMFNNLLIQNTITGCTVMINKKLALLTLPIPDEIIMHDWWLGLIASKFGKIVYINEPLIQYRQHTSNSIGANQLNIRTIFNKLFEKNILYLNQLQAKVFLVKFEKKLDYETIEMLEEFIKISTQSFWQKREILLKYKLFKQGIIRNIGLFLKI